MARRAGRAHPVALSAWWVMPKGLLSPKRIKERRRILKAVELAAEGVDFQQIAIQLGYSSKDMAQQAVRRAIQAVPAPDAATYRTLQGMRLDRAIEALMPQVADGDLKAIDVMVKVEERRAKLYGLDGGGANDPVSEEEQKKKARAITTAEEDSAKIVKVLAESGGFAEMLAEGTPLASLFLPEGLIGDDDDVPIATEDPQMIERLAEGFRANNLDDGVIEGEYSIVPTGGGRW